MKYNSSSDQLKQEVDSIKTPEHTKYYKSIISAASLVDHTFYHHNHDTNEVFLIHKHEFGMYCL